MTKLKDGQTTLVDLGNAKGLSVRNLTATKVRVYVDYRDGEGSWQPITDEISLTAGGLLECKKQDLGHEHVRVGVLGPDDGSDLVEVKP
jgi:hypothetical protein